MEDHQPGTQFGDTFAMQLKQAVSRAVGLKERARNAATQEALVWQAFQELDTAHEELRETEAHLHSQADALAAAIAELELERIDAHEIFDAAPQAYLVSDATGRIVRANRASSDLLCIEPQFLPGAPLIRFVERAYRDRFHEMIATSTASEKPRKRELKMRPRGSGPGIDCIASVASSTRAAVEGSVLRWIFCELPRDRMPRDEDSAQFPSGESAGLLRQLSLELRTNLSSTVGWLQIVRQHMSDNDAGLRAIGSVTRTLRGLVGLAERLGEYARLEQEDPLLRRVPIDLLEFVGQLVEELRLPAIHRGLRLSALLESRVPAISGDRARLHDAILAVFSDVARSTAPGGELYIWLSASGQNARLEIRSSGCGIDQGVLQSIEMSDGRLRDHASASALDGALSRALRCLELHGATIRSQVTGDAAQLCLTVTFPQLQTRRV
jgi:PAS domain-containing protein